MINNDAIGYITANYTTIGKSSLTETRPLAALPFMGRYRLIDFPLSNMMNAGIRTVGVVLPPNYRPLADHLGAGRPWELDRKRGGLFLLPGNAFGTTRQNCRFLMRDIIANRVLFERSRSPYVVMSATNIVFNMDLGAVIDAHATSGAEITMVYTRAKRAETDTMRMEIGDAGRVRSLYPTGGCQYGDAEFLDLFVINRDTLLQIIEDYSNYDYKDFFEALDGDIALHDVCTYEFKGLSIGMFDVESYYRRSMEVLDPSVMDELFHPDRPIMTKAHDTPPASYSSGSNAQNSFISAGCRIEGTVRGSILSRDVVVEPGAYVANSIVMQSCLICRGARVENAILDKNNVVPSQTELRGTPDATLVLSKAPIPGCTK